jgi:hypothetical protein
MFRPRSIRDYRIPRALSKGRGELRGRLLRQAVPVPTSQTRRRYPVSSGYRNVIISPLFRSYQSPPKMDLKKTHIRARKKTRSYLCLVAGGGVAQQMDRRMRGTIHWRKAEAMVKPIHSERNIAPIGEASTTFAQFLTTRRAIGQKPKLAGNGLRGNFDSTLMLERPVITRVPEKEKKDGTGPLGESAPFRPRAFQVSAYRPKGWLVGAVGIEPTTFGLKGRCSTTELRP